MDLIFSLLAQGISLGFAATSSPGPYLNYAISETLRRGWRHSFRIMFAPLISDGPVILLMCFLLGSLPPIVIRIIQIIGGLFVLYLAWGILRQLRQDKEVNFDTNAAAESGNRILLRGAVINFFSPGLWIFWSTVNGPIVVKAWRESPPAAIAFLVGFYGLLIGGTGVWIMIFHQARRLDPRVVRMLLILNVLVMTGFALLLLKAGVFD